MKRLLMLLPALAFTHCAPEIPPTQQTTTPLNPARDYRPVDGDPTVDDVARFLAGRPVEHGAALARWQMRDGDYHTHALVMDSRWRNAGRKRAVAQAQFYYTTTRNAIGNPSTVVYPFGGPDILHATSMFPKASTYVLLGLESVGSVPDFSAGVSKPMLADLAGVLEAPILHGYFITETMRQSPPATPILLTSLGIMGARVDSISAIDAGGRPGVEIRFRGPQGGSKRVLYVSADLSNRGFDSSFQSWLNRYSGGAAYFKAASYLPHDSAFSSVRQWVLSHAKVVLQDDSGIPFKDFDPGTWETTLLGNYERPIPLFANFRQPDLAAAYDAAAGRTPSIPFGSGYHMRAAEANLQIQRRR
ncbi:hypothetical protein HNR46_001559 [Haloferula luteola]|uniref:Uncharacterized protein n=1 Tax=Haloferula luteola TaxID=595692 RepID=A0A840V1P6_9BACT|nr:hypothetical protein [Haloferula luteola]MBB5351323.1 hypothetical protein [Haloferula luteola]